MCLRSQHQTVVCRQCNHFGFPLGSDEPEPSLLFRQFSTRIHSLSVYDYCCFNRNYIHHILSVVLISTIIKY